MTAVWWERQIDPSIVFGIPGGVMDMQGNYLEKPYFTTGYFDIQYSGRGDKRR